MSGPSDRDPDGVRDADPAGDADRVRRIFDEVVTLDPVERPAHLARACLGNTALREEVESLLANADAKRSPLSEALAGIRLGKPAAGCQDPGGGVPEDLKDALADRYVLLREIGRGGMATVYLAEDLRHTRKVAIKVFDTELAASPRRFLREIEIIAKLTHPHILPLHDSGEVGGYVYFVMPYVRAGSLAARLERERQLSIEDALRITRETAEALDAAHQSGFVHRDVKPANILLEAGHAVLADFGVAHAVAPADSPRLTQRGVSLGTPQYMSPEQGSGEIAQDARTDQYSLACVLYEMLAGRAPFVGPSTESVLRQHALATPTPIDEMRAGVPEGLASALNRALSKSPVDRFGTMRDFLKALPRPIAPASIDPPRARRRRLVVAGLLVVVAATIGYGLLLRGRPVAGTAAAALPEDRVAVMPFENRTGDAGFDDLSLLAAWEITDGLHWTDQLRSVAVEAVIGSIDSDDGTSGGPSVAADLGAGTVVTGAYRLDGDTLEIRSEIIRSATGEAVFAVSSRGPALDRMTVLRDLRDQVMGALGVMVDPVATYWIKRPPRYEALQAYMRAKERQFAGDDAEAVRRYLEAYDLDSTFLLALMGAVGRLISLDQHAKADSLLRVIEPRWNELSLNMRFWFEFFEAGLDGDRLGQLRIARDAFERTGDAAWAYTVAEGATNLNRPLEALQALERVDYDDPVVQAFPPFWRIRAHANHKLERYEEAYAAVLDGLDRFPNHVGLRDQEIRDLIALGRLDESLERIAAVGSVDPQFLYDAGGVLLWASAEMARHGHERDALAVSERAIGWYADEQPLDPWAPWAYVQAGRAAEAVDLAARLVERNPERLLERETYGVVLAAAGERARAQEVIRWLEQLDAPYLRGTNTKALASIRAHLGDRAEAIRLFREAEREGSALWDVHSWTDYQPLWGYEPFEELARPKG